MLEGHEHCAICLIAKSNPILATGEHEIIHCVTQDDLAELMKRLTAEKAFDLGRYSHVPPRIILGSYAQLEEQFAEGFPRDSIWCFAGVREPTLYEGLYDKMRDRFSCLEESHIYPIKKRPDYVESPVERLESQNAKDKMPPSHLLSSLIKRFRVKEDYEKPDSEKSWGPLFSNPNSSADCARDES